MEIPSRQQSFGQKLGLLLLDVFCLIGVIGAVLIWRLDVPFSVLLGSPGLLFIATTCLLSLYVFGAYDLSAALRPRTLFLRLSVALAATLIVAVLVNYLFAKERAGLFGRGVFLGGLVAFGVTAFLLRLALLSGLRKAARRERWLFLVEPQRFEILRQELASILRADSYEISAVGDGSPVRLEELMRSRDACVFQASSRILSVYGDELIHLRFGGVPVIPLVDFYETSFRKIPVDLLETEWFARSPGFGFFQSPLTQKMKRLIDVFGALILLPVFAPFMILTAIAVRLESPGAALYRQVRTGRNGGTFVIYKFRSMRMDAEKNGPQWAGKTDARITRVGRFIRKVRFDELPQLFNVLKGEMSFVGPRPERPEFNESLAKQIPFYEFRHLVNPGLTGWAQILYPYGASVEDSKRKLEYDLFYVKNGGLILDLKILLKTIRVVVFAGGR